MFYFISASFTFKIYYRIIFLLLFLVSLHCIVTLFSFNKFHLWQLKLAIPVITLILSCRLSLNKRPRGDDLF